MKAQTFETEELKAELERALGFSLRSLQRLDGASALNFKAVRDSDGLTFAVKCHLPRNRWLCDLIVEHLEVLKGTKAVARIFERECPPTFRDHSIICTTWCNGVRIFPDRLTKAQLVACMDEYMRFSEAMQRARTFFPPRPIDTWRTELLARCHGLGGALMRRLLTEFPAEDCAYRKDLLRVIHGDFHYGNFLFVNGAVDGYLDFEEFRAGYPTDDLLRYFVCASEHLRWYAWGRRRRTLSRFALAVRHLPYTHHEWLVAVNARFICKIYKRSRHDKTIRLAQAVNIAWRSGLYRKMRQIVNAEFQKISVDLNELESTLANALGRRYHLTPLGIKCTYPVFRAEAEGVPPAFVKIGTRAEWERTRRVIDEVRSDEFFTRFRCDEPIPYKSFDVFVMDWRDSKIVRPEDMTEAEADRFTDACARLSTALQGVTAVTDVRDLPIAPERLYETLRAYATRHPLAARALGALLDIPAAERTFGDRPRAVVHGDFHSKNFGFDDQGKMSVCDFDKLMQGIACGDLANALVERFSCLGLSHAARRRLRSVTRRIIARAPWPREDFAVICNVLRLQFAARRIEKHPHSVWVALDILRRDRKIRQFLECLK